MSNDLVVVRHDPGRLFRELVREASLDVLVELAKADDLDRDDLAALLTRVRAELADLRRRLDALTPRATKTAGARRRRLALFKAAGPGGRMIAARLEKQMATRRA